MGSGLFIKYSDPVNSYAPRITGPERASTDHASVTLPSISGPRAASVGRHHDHIGGPLLGLLQDDVGDLFV